MVSFRAFGNAGLWLINYCSVLVHAEYSLREQAEENSPFLWSSGSHASGPGSSAWVPAWLVYFSLLLFVAVFR
jgi:hypothetical protein